MDCVAGRKNQGNPRYTIAAVLGGSFIILLLGLMADSPPPAFGATISPDTTVDEPYPTVNGNCTLREAVIAAQLDAAVDACLAGSGADIVFIPAGVYVITEGSISLGTELTLDGESGTYIDGGGSSSIFKRAGSTSTVTIQDMTIRNGFYTGGSCFSQGTGYTTILSDVTITDCATDVRGGAIYSSGTLTIMDSIIENNVASDHPSGYNSGGAIYMTGGDLTIIRTTFNNNRAESGSADPGLLEGAGGAIRNGGPGTVEVIDSTFTNNVGKKGGAINSNGPVKIMGSTFHGNTATSGGGALSVVSLVVTNSTFTGNTEGAISGNGGSIQSSTFVNNFDAPTLTIDSGILTIKNSILYTDAGSHCAGTIVSGGYNLDNNGTCGFAAPGDLSGVDPRIGGLRYNGGPTKTHNLKNGSPAIDAANPAGCTDDVSDPILTDQRGWSRPIDGDLDGTPTCDIGAYEATMDLFLPMIMR